MNKALLVVEDEEDIRLAYQVMAEDLLEDVEICLTAGVPEAKTELSRILESGADVVAIVDGNIAGERGEDFAEYARSRGKVWIIACSAGGVPTTWGNDNFGKPLDIVEIAACVTLRFRQQAA